MLSRSSLRSLKPFAPIASRSFHTDRIEDLRPWERRTVTLMPGDGIGPELVNGVKTVFAAIDAPIDWEEYPDVIVDKGLKPQVSSLLLDSLRRTRVGLKGPLRPSVAPGSKGGSVNKLIAEQLGLYANVVPAKSFSWLETRHRDIDIVVIRENTEGEYSGLEHEAAPGVVESLKVITRTASLRVAEFAFSYAHRNNRRKVTAVHKANIMKLSDGLFLESCNAVSKKYPTIEYNSMIVDNTAMQLVNKPGQFDVILTPNLYGSIVTNMAAGLTGGPGLLGGANVGDNAAVFEQGARHLGYDIAGENKANPTGMLLSSVMMLRYLGLHSYATRIHKAVMAVGKQKISTTADVGGSASTDSFVRAVIANMAN